MKRLLPLLLTLLFLTSCGSVNAAAPEVTAPPPEEPAPPAIVLPKEEEVLPVRTVDPGRPMVALTFDDGPPRSIYCPDPGHSGEARCGGHFL